MSGTPLEALLRQIRTQAERPATQALSLPPACYWREDVWELEVERIFRRDWLCVGRGDQLPAPGDWLKVDLLGEPLVIVRGDDGVLRALSRVCRHRGMDLLHDSPTRSGHGALLTCPYHLWSYTLDGRLKASPMMQANTAHAASRCHLPTFALSEWQGFVFVYLDDAAPPLAPRMQRVEQLLGTVDMSDWRIAGSVNWGESSVNWKVALENFAEFYHHIGTHQNSLQLLWPASRVSLDMRGEDAFMAGRMAVNPELATGMEDGHPIQATHLPVVPGLSAEQRGGTLVLAMFPLFAFALSPDSAIWFEWYPTGPESHVLDIHLLVPGSSFDIPGFEQIVAEHLQAIRGVQDEDAAANEAVQRGLRSRFAASGPLAELEQPLWQFQRYLAGRLCD